MRSLVLFVLVLALFSCSSHQRSNQGTIRIGVDPLWYPNDFGAQQPYVNGFIEELLLDIAEYSGLRIEKVSANWDSLMEGMSTGGYDAVLSTFPSYEYHKQKYDFSQNILNLGPVLIAPKGSSFQELSELHRGVIGVLSGNSLARVIVEQYPKLGLREYSSLVLLLDALVNGDIQAALHDALISTEYVQNQYTQSLEIVGEPLTDRGIHLVSLKEKGAHLFKKFDAALSHLQKKKQLQSLLQKWQFAPLLDE